MRLSTSTTTSTAKSTKSAKKSSALDLVAATNTKPHRNRGLKTVDELRNMATSIGRLADEAGASNRIDAFTTNLLHAPLSLPGHSYPYLQPSYLPQPSSCPPTRSPKKEQSLYRKAIEHLQAHDLDGLTEDEFLNMLDTFRDPSAVREFMLLIEADLPQSVRQKWLRKKLPSPSFDPFSSFSPLPHSHISTGHPSLSNGATDAASSSTSKGYSFAALERSGDIPF